MHLQRRLQITPPRFFIVQNVPQIDLLPVSFRPHNLVQIGQQRPHGPLLSILLRPGLHLRLEPAAYLVLLVLRNYLGLLALPELPHGRLLRVVHVLEALLDSLPGHRAFCGVESVGVQFDAGTLGRRGGHLAGNVSAWTGAGRRLSGLVFAADDGPALFDVVPDLLLGFFKVHLLTAQTLRAVFLRRRLGRRHRSGRRHHVEGRLRPENGGGRGQRRVRVRHGRGVKTEEGLDGAAARDGRDGRDRGRLRSRPLRLGRRRTRRGPPGHSGSGLRPSPPRPQKFLLRRGPVEQLERHHLGRVGVDEHFLLAGSAPAREVSLHPRVQLPGGALQHLRELAEGAAAAPALAPPDGGVGGPGLLRFLLGRVGRFEDLADLAEGTVEDGEVGVLVLDVPPGEAGGGIHADAPDVAVGAGGAQGVQGVTVALHDAEVDAAAAAEGLLGELEGVHGAGLFALRVDDLVKDQDAAGRHSGVSRSADAGKRRNAGRRGGSHR
mmetsp:Transcript_18087/g.41128  ORF Transcript_18087/g.41128 Transcript_18087/m.41128 type:complete len:493 (+) Transcript_18087:238-1716(+)